MKKFISFMFGWGQIVLMFMIVQAILGFLISGHYNLGYRIECIIIGLLSFIGAILVEIKEAIEHK